MNWGIKNGSNQLAINWFNSGVNANKEQITRIVGQRQFLLVIISKFYSVEEILAMKIITNYT